MHWNVSVKCCSLMGIKVFSLTLRWCSHIQGAQLCVLEGQMGSSLQTPSLRAASSASCLLVNARAPQFPYQMTSVVQCLLIGICSWLIREVAYIVYIAISAWQYVLLTYVLKYNEKWKRRYNHLWVIKDRVLPTTFADNKLSLSWKIKYLISFSGTEPL